MKNGFQNVYKMGRELSGLSQEKASDLLNISTRCLRYYESGDVPTPDDMAYHMMGVYGVPYLGWLHLQQNVVGANILPPLSPELYGAALGLQGAIHTLYSKVPVIAKIAEDNLIDSEEAQIWDSEVRPPTRHMSGYLMTLALHPEKRDSRLLAAR